MDISSLTQSSRKISALQTQQARSNIEVGSSQENPFLRNLTGLKKQELQKEASSTLDKDDFLKILITQLQNQDPSKPMEDKEFIAQMAQFSSLEQMTNMSKGFEDLSGAMNRTFALSLIGKTVEIQPQNSNPVKGVVSEVLTGEEQKVKVNGVMYSSDDIIRVSTAEVH